MIDKFEILKNYKTWVLKFSGGLDSTLILYYMNKLRTDQELWLMTGVNDNETISNTHIRDIITKLDIKNAYHVMYSQTHNSGDEKREKDYEFYKRVIPLFDKEKTIVVQGRTKNPPFNIKGQDNVRNHGGQEFEKVMDFTLYRPWVNIDKKQIIEMYRRENIESIISLTRSCISFIENECGKCFWCKERKWGLGERS